MKEQYALARQKKSRNITGILLDIEERKSDNFRSKT